MSQRWTLIGRITLQQIYTHGIRGFFIILIATVFSGYVIIAEYGYHIRLVTREVSFVPPFATLMILTELGPILACLLLTAFSGAALAAETGMLRLTEQWDAMKIEQIPRFWFYIFPRVAACTIISMGLTLFNMAGELTAAVVVSPFTLGITSQLFYNRLFTLVGSAELIQGMFKAFIFGITYPSVAIYFGLKAHGTAASIGTRATQAVVMASMGIIILDFCISFLFSTL
jgi:phospholipid/cholesterol/gamma-HCH transport system permease protein